jgi:hypothetical protein
MTVARIHTCAGPRVVVGLGQVQRLGTPRNPVR